MNEILRRADREAIHLFQASRDNASADDFVNLRRLSAIFPLSSMAT